MLVEKNNYVSATTKPFEVVQNNSTQQDPEAVLLQETVLNSTKPLSTYWNPLAIIEGVIEQAKNGRFIGDGRTWGLLFNALQAVTGLEATPERQTAIKQFIKALLQKQNADVTGDGKVSAEDMIEVFKKGVFEVPHPSPPPPPPPLNPLEETINKLIQKAKLAASGEVKPLNAEDMELLLKSLEELTGTALDDKRKQAVEKFIRAIEANKPADVNGTGPTNIKDLLIVYETGKFVPIGFDPGNPSNGGNPKGLHPIDFNKWINPNHSLPLTDDENKKANQLRVQIYNLLAPHLKDGLSEEMIKALDKGLIASMSTVSGGAVSRYGQTNITRGPDFTKFIQQFLTEKLTKDENRMLIEFLSKLPEIKSFAP